MPPQGQPPRPRPITQTKQLVVEGRDALEFFRSFLQHLNLTAIQVQNFGGVNEFGDFLTALTKMSGFAQVTSLGVVRDAEKNAGSAFQSVCSGLQKASLSIPKQPILVTDSTPHISVFILPDCTNPGMLETLCLQTVEDDPVLPCVEEYFECVAQTGDPPGNMEKARLHAFLASRSKPDLLLGQAARAGYWPWNSPAFRALKQFLRAL